MPRQRKRSRRLPQVLEQHEAEALLEQPNARCPTGLRNRAMLELMYRAGLRVGEVVALRPSDIHWSMGELHLRRTKGGRDRVVPLRPSTLEWLRLWRERRDALAEERKWPERRRRPFFTTVKGTPVMVRYLQQMVERLAEKAGMERHVHPHMLRHTFATEMLDKGFNVRQVQTLLGHADLRTTQVYTEVNQTELRKEVQALDEEGHEAEPEAINAGTIRLAKALQSLSPEQRRALADLLAEDEQQT